MEFLIVSFVILCACLRSMIRLCLMVLRDEPSPIVAVRPAPQVFHFAPAPGGAQLPASMPFVDLAEQTEAADLSLPGRSAGATVIS